VDSDTWMQIIVLILLTMGAAYFAASEISYASINKIRLKNYADNGDKRAKKAIYITDNFDKALSTILIGNNIMHISFASLATVIATRLWGIESVKYTTILAVVIVFLVSEMIPKSYAKANSIKVVLGVSNSLLYLMKLLTPFTFFFTVVSNLVSKIFPAPKDSGITEEEFYDIIETANEEGVFDRNKHELIESALDFDDIIVGDIHTKREDIIAINIELSEAEIIEIIKLQKYSRVPVYKTNLDNIIGILNVRKFLKQYIKYKKFDINAALLDAYFIVIGESIDDILKQMSSKKIHMAIVIDDQNKTLGIVTVEDILEELVGEIWDEDDIINKDFAKLGGDRYEVSGSLSVVEVFHRLGYQNIEVDPTKKISQWASELFNGEPKVDDIFYEKDFEVNILRIDSGKVTSIIIKLL